MSKGVPSWERIEKAINGEGNGEGINHQTVEEGLFWLDRLRAIGFPPPKIFTHGGDAITFVWGEGGTAGRLYLTPTSKEDASVFLKD